MVNYETYKQLTEEQKREYDFKFNNENIFEFIKVINWQIIVSMLILTILLLTVGFIFLSNNPNMVTLQKNVSVYISGLGTFFNWYYGIIIFTTLYYVCGFCFQMYAENKFFKKCNIKRKWSWFWYK